MSRTPEEFIADRFAAAGSSLREYTETIKKRLGHDYETGMNDKSSIYGEGVITSDPYPSMDRTLAEDEKANIKLKMYCGGMYPPRISVISETRLISSVGLNRDEDVATFINQFQSRIDKGEDIQDAASATFNEILEQRAGNKNDPSREIIARELELRNLRKTIFQDPEIPKFGPSWQIT